MADRTEPSPAVGAVGTPSDRSTRGLAIACSTDCATSAPATPSAELFVMSRRLAATWLDAGMQSLRTHGSTAVQAVSTNSAELRRQGTGARSTFRAAAVNNKSFLVGLEDRAAASEGEH